MTSPQYGLKLSNKTNGCLEGEEQWLSFDWEQQQRQGKRLPATTQSSSYTYSKENLRSSSWMKKEGKKTEKQQSLKSQLLVTWLKTNLHDFMWAEDEFFSMLGISYSIQYIAFVFVVVTTARLSHFSCFKHIRILYFSSYAWPTFKLSLWLNSLQART